MHFINIKFAKMVLRFSITFMNFKKGYKFKGFIFQLINLFTMISLN